MYVRSLYGPGLPARRDAPRSHRLRLEKDPFHGHRHQSSDESHAEGNDPGQSGQKASQGGSPSVAPRCDRQQSRAEEHAGPDRKGVRRRGHHAPGHRARPRRSTASPPAACRWTSPWAARAFPSGRIVEIFGPESSGKTTLALHVVAQAQRKPAASPPSSTPSTPWTPAGPRSWASSWKRCWSASPAAAKRPCTSPKCSSSPTPST